MADKDKADSKLRFFFYEQRIHSTDQMQRVLATDMGRAAPRNLMTFSIEPKLIQDKWLYIFYSEGAEYAIRPGNGDTDRRLSPLYARQTTSPLTLRARGPVRTSQPKEHAQNVKYEVFFDQDGYLYWRDISGEWRKPRHQRQHPRTAWQKQQEADRKEPQKTKTMYLPLRIPDKPGGKNVRYYFLLSTIRLGPKALEACTQPGAGDGLSIHPKQWGTLPAWMTAEDIETLKKAYPGSYKEVLDDYQKIGVVDPYKLAADIHDHMYLLTYDKYVDIIERIKNGQPCGKLVSKKHLDNRGNRGTVFDLYFIAKMLKGYAKSLYDEKTKKDGRLPPANWIPFEWDEAGAEEVIRFVEKTLKHLKNAVEARALFLVHWLTGPAHRLIDVAVTQDTLEAGDKDTAAQDRAYGLIHWHKVAGVLGLTGTGSAFLSGMSKTCSDNPVYKILFGYKNKKIRVGSIDWQALALAKRVVPDLVLMSALTDLHDAAAKSKDSKAVLTGKAHGIANLMNNLQYFEKRLEVKTDFPKLPDNTFWQTIQPYVNNGLLVMEKPGEAVTQFLEDYTAPRATPYVDGLYTWLDKRIPSFGDRMLKAYKYQDRIVKPIVGAKLFAAAANMLLGQAANVSALKDKDAGLWKRAEAAIDMTLGAGAVLEGVCDLMNIEKATWDSVMKLRSAGATRLASIARLGTALTLVSLLSAVWTIYTNVRDLTQAVDRDDYSVVAGCAFAVVGGLILLGNGIWLASAGKLLAFLGGGIVGLVAAVVIAIGGLIVWLTTDTPWETFIEHCYFAEDADDRNQRSFGGSDDWSGPKWPHKWQVDGQWRTWPVLHQRIALTNMLSRYVAQSGAAMKHKDTQTMWCEVSATSLTVRYSMLPMNTRFVVKVVCDNKTRCRFTYDPWAEQKLTVHEGPWTAKDEHALDRKTGEERVKFEFGKVNEKVHDRLAASIEMTHDGGVLALSHPIVSLGTRTRKTGPEYFTYYVASANGALSGPADDFKLKALPSPW